MSFNFSVSAGPAAEFTQRATAAKAALEAQYEANDYALTQIASATADAAVKAAAELVAYLAGDSAGTAGVASIAGHHPTPDSSQTASVSISVQFTPATPVAASA